MKSLEELNATIRAAMKKAGLRQDTLAKYLGFKNHTVISRKLVGRVPWTYQEIVLVSQLLNMPDVAQDVQEEPATPDLGIRLLGALLGKLSDRDRREFLLVSAIYLKNLRQAPPLVAAQTKALRDFAQGLSKSGRKPR